MVLRLDVYCNINFKFSCISLLNKFVLKYCNNAMTLSLDAILQY